MKCQRAKQEAADRAENIGIRLVARAVGGDNLRMEVIPNLMKFPELRGTGETSGLLLAHPAFTLEHIVSRGEASPPGFWYDQARDEWVTLLQGRAELCFESGRIVLLNAGDAVRIRAHERHRVESTSQDAVWLALHFEAQERC